MRKTATVSIWKNQTERRSEMAKKDTMNALLSRDIKEQTAELLIAKYSTLKAIGSAGVAELVALGIDESEANEVISKIVKRTTRSKTKSVAESNAPAVKLEFVSKSHEYTETETKLKSICDKNGYDLPLKVIMNIAKRIEGSKLSANKIEALLSTAQEIYDARKIDPHESVGVMTAQSIGEPGTQMNLRTFHNAGVANLNVTTGLPRLLEIVGAREKINTPSMTVPLIGVAAEDENVAKHVAYEIEMTKLLDVADIETDVINMRLIIRPDVHKMDTRGVTTDDIVNALNDTRGLHGLVSVDEFNIVIRCDEQSNSRLQHIHEFAKTAKIKGIDRIKKAILSKKGSVWEIVTEGSNLKEVVKIEGVDAANVKTNDIREVEKVLGIEAARNAIIEEARETLSAAGAVDIRHIMLVADTMTNEGRVKSISFSGVAGDKTNVLSKAAFERVAQVLPRAAVEGKTNTFDGVVDNIAIGQPIKLGTGAVNLIYTPKKGEEQ